MVQVPVLAIHGGAGTINREALSAEAEREYRGALQSILEKGRDALAAGASALDAVTLAVSMLEDCPLFNAGRGAVYTSAETHEMDAAIMDGSTLRTGALSCVHGVKNPIRAARVVMEQSPHVLMTSDGAMAFLREHGVEFMPDAYFDTEHRLAQLHQAQARQPGAAVLDHDGAAAASKLSFAGNPLDEKTKMGTVGAVALDSRGNLAAATSTGGMTNKRFGRVGDSPIIGAGTYANNETVAVSCTGSGEMFIRTSAAYNVHAHYKLLGQDVQKAGDAAIAEVGAIKGSGGMIILDAKGNFAFPMNSAGMYRGTISKDGVPMTAIFADEELKNVDVKKLRESK